MLIVTYTEEYIASQISINRERDTVNFFAHKYQKFLTIPLSDVIHLELTKTNI